MSSVRQVSLVFYMFVDVDFLISKKLTERCYLPQLCFSDLPGPPRDFKVSDVTRGTCRLTWKAPECDGGDRVKSYFIEKKTIVGKAWTKVRHNPPPPAFIIKIVFFFFDFFFMLFIREVLLLWTSVDPNLFFSGEHSLYQSVSSGSRPV